MPNDYDLYEPSNEAAETEEQLAREHAAPLESGEEGFLDFREYGLMVAELKRLKNAVKKIQEELNRRQKRVLHYLTQRGLRGVTLDDLNMTIYMHPQIYARARFPYQSGDVIRALRDTGHQEFIYETYNTSRLSDWVRTLQKNHEDNEQGVLETVGDLLDPRLAEVLDVEPTVRIQSCAATRKSR